MATLKLNDSLKNELAKKFPDTFVKYVSGSTLFCDFLLRVIDSDVHAINLTKFLDSSVLSFHKNPDVLKYLESAPEIYRANTIDLPEVDWAWATYYLPRVYVFFHTTKFDGKRLDSDLISIILENLNHLVLDPANFSYRISEGEKHLTFFSRKCKDEAWYYDIGNVLDTIDDSITMKTRQNTRGIFMTIIEAIKPKFIDDLSEIFGRGTILKMIASRHL